MMGVVQVVRNIVRVSNRINKRYRAKKKRNFDERPCGPALRGRRRHLFRRREDNLGLAILAIVGVGLVLAAVLFTF